MIEQAHIDKYSHDNDIDGVVKSVASLNNTVEAVMKWMGNRKDTAI
jgi:alkaline phosphatase